MSVKQLSKLEYNINKKIYKNREDRFKLIKLTKRAKEEEWLKFSRKIIESKPKCDKRSKKPMNRFRP